MKCECGVEITGSAAFCSECGTSCFVGIDSSQGSFAALSGFGRTLSTELLAKQEKLYMLKGLESMVECRTYLPGEKIDHQGELSRDLYFLTAGRVEITTSRSDEDIVLNEIGSPYILGDIGFMLGVPRTATIRAKSQVTVFVLQHREMKKTIGEFPGWLNPLLKAFVSSIKSLNDTISNLEQEVQRLQQ